MKNKILLKIGIKIITDKIDKKLDNNVKSDITFADIV